MEQSTAQDILHAALLFHLYPSIRKFWFFIPTKGLSNVCTGARTRPVREMHNREVRRWALWDASKTWWRAITVWDRDLGLFPCALRGGPELLEYKTKRRANTSRQVSRGNCCKIPPLTWSIVLIYFLLLYPSLKFSLKKSNCKPFPHFCFPYDQTDLFLLPLQTVLVTGCGFQ